MHYRDIRGGGKRSDFLGGFAKTMDTDLVVYTTPRGAYTCDGSGYGWVHFLPD